MELVRLPAVKQGVVKVGRPVIKGREQKAKFRRLYEPVANPVLDVVGLCIVAKSRFCQFNRTDAAKDVVIHIFRCIKIFNAVCCDFRNIISVMNQNNKIIFRIAVIFNYFVIKGIQQFIIGQFAL